MENRHVARELRDVSSMMMMTVSLSRCEVLNARRAFVPIGVEELLHREIALRV